MKNHQEKLQQDMSKMHEIIKKQDHEKEEQQKTIQSLVAEKDAMQKNVDEQLKQSIDTINVVRAQLKPYKRERPSDSDPVMEPSTRATASSTPKRQLNSVKRQRTNSSTTPHRSSGEVKLQQPNSTTNSTSKQQ